MNDVNNNTKELDDMTNNVDFETEKNEEFDMDKYDILNEFDEERLIENEEDEEINSWAEYFSAGLEEGYESRNSDVIRAFIKGYHLGYCRGCHDGYEEATQDAIDYICRKNCCCCRKRCCCCRRRNCW